MKNHPNGKERLATRGEIQRIEQQLAQRNAELAIINSLQAALAAKLDMQGIYDAVGENIRAVFDAQGVAISYYDRSSNYITTPYYLFRGKRIKEPGFELGEGLTSYIIHSGNLLLINERAQERYQELGAIFADSESEDTARSWLGVPLIALGEVIGTIALENYEREHAFSDADVRLLQTIANSMSVALENAHLFSETQRMLKETEKRNAELAIINSVQAALAARLDVQGIYHTVCDKIGEIFNAQVVDIGLYDPQENLLHFPYTIERGEFFPDEPMELIGYRKHVIETGQHLLINEDHHEAAAEYSNPISIVGEAPKSVLFVPLLVGGEAKGVISIQNLDQEKAFSESDVSLLTTLVNAMSVALENARLFDETQRLLKETEERNAELTLLNQTILATTSVHDSISVLEIVCRELAEIFEAPRAGAAVFNREHTSLTIVAEYLGEGRSTSLGESIPINANPITQYVLKNKAPLAVKDVMRDGRMESIRHLFKEGDIASMLVVPLLARDEIIGTISLELIERHEFTAGELELAFNAARSTAQALANARLYEETNAALAELQRVEESRGQGNDKVDRYLSQEIREEIENTYYAKINERGQLDNAVLDPEFLKNTLNHMTLYSDHGVVHVRDVARNILGVLETINGVLIPHRERQSLEFMKGYGVMLAYNHDIGLVDFTAQGRAMHPEFAAKKVFAKDYDEIVETIWNENWGNVAWRLINLVEQGVYEGDAKLILREMLSMSVGHSKSKVPIAILNEPCALRELMLRSISTEIQHLNYQQKIRTAEAKLHKLMENGSENEIQEQVHLVADLQAAYEEFCKGGTPIRDEVIQRFYSDFEKEAYTWIDSDHPALQRLTLDVVDTLRALRVADALRQRGSTLKTSGGYPIFIDQNTANAVIALQKGSGEVLMFEVDKMHSIGEANIASSEVTLEGNLRISFHRGSFLNKEAVQRAVHSCAMIVEDIQEDTIESFRRPTQASTQRKSGDDIQILIEETNDSLSFSEMVLDELAQINPDLSKRSRIVPSLSHVSDEERRRYLTAIELERSDKQRQQIIAQMAQQGKKMRKFDAQAAFADVRLIALREGEVLLEIGSPPGFVYVPMGEGLVSLPQGGYQPQNAPAWIPLGNTRVIRGDVQEAQVIAEKGVQLIMIPRAVYLKHWHETYKVEELAEALNHLYVER